MDSLILDQFARMSVVFMSKDRMMPHVDHRRTLYIAFASTEENFVLRDSAALVWTSSKQIFGNHYHPVKREAFFVLRGYMQVTLRNVAGTVRFPMEAGDRLAIPPLTAHSFETIAEQGILITYSDRPWSVDGDIVVTDL